MILAFKRRVEEQYIDLDKMAKDGKVIRDIEGSPNGYYSVIIVPTYLIGKKVIILPLNEDGTPTNIKEMSDFK